MGQTSTKAGNYPDVTLKISSSGFHRTAVIQVGLTLYGRKEQTYLPVSYLASGVTSLAQW